jgi:ubiquinone/menaquinone biosynthesis C-methylase UbiE
MEKLPFGTGEFDRSMFFASLHHVKNTDKALKEAARVTKPGGFLFLCEPVSFRSLLLSRGIRPTPDGVEFSFSQQHLWKNVRQIEGRVEYVYFEGFIKRFLPSNTKLKTLRFISRLEENINAIPVIRYVFGVFAESITIIIKLA